MSNLEQAQSQDKNITSISEEQTQECSSTQIEVLSIPSDVIELFLQQYLETEEGYN